MFKLAIEVLCFENNFGLIHAILLLLGSTKSVYFFWDTRYIYTDFYNVFTENFSIYNAVHLSF